MNLGHDIKCKVNILSTHKHNSQGMYQVTSIYGWQRLSKERALSFNVDFAILLTIENLSIVIIIYSSI